MSPRTKRRSRRSWSRSQSELLVEHPVAGGATDAWSSVGVDMGMDIEHPFSVEPPARVDAVGPGGEPAAEQGVAHMIDEFKYYIDRRIVGAHSALLALRSVPELELKPPSQSLPLHLEGRRQVRCLSRAPLLPLFAVTCERCA